MLIALMSRIVSTIRYFHSIVPPSLSEAINHDLHRNFCNKRAEGYTPTLHGGVVMTIRYRKKSRAKGAENTWLN
jgi:hypothetical protein